MNCRTSGRGGDNFTALQYNKTAWAVTLDQLSNAYVIWVEFMQN